MIHFAKLIVCPRASIVGRFQMKGKFAAAEKEINFAGKKRDQSCSANKSSANCQEYFVKGGAIQSHLNGRLTFPD